MWPLLLAAYLGASPAEALEPPPITEPLRSRSRGTGDAAVVVGNQDYAFLPDVPHAARDADAFATTLVYTRGVAPDRLRDLRGANREQLLGAVQGASAWVGDGGTLWIYFAGHGAADPGSGELMLVGDDAKADASVFARRGVSLSELRAAAGSATVAMVLDTCFSGVGRGGESLVPGTRFAVPSWRGAPRDPVWTATSPDQVAGVYEAARHGRFTYFVVGAMRGWADGELDGHRDEIVTASEASAYVARALRTLQVTDQQPILDGAAPDWVLSRGASEAGPPLVDLPWASGAELKLGGGAGLAQGPPRAFGRAPPLVHVGGSVYQDAAKRPVAWVEVRELAEEDPEGRRAVRRRRGAVLAQVVVTAAAAEFSIAGPLTHALGREECRSQGDCTMRDFGTGLTVVGVGLIAWDVALFQRARSHREATLEAANRVLDQ